MNLKKIVYIYYCYIFYKNKHFTKEEIRRYLENDEAIDSIDYLIELKNNEKNTKLNLLKYIQTAVI